MNCSNTLLSCRFKQNQVILWEFFIFWIFNCGFSILTLLLLCTKNILKMQYKIILFICTPIQTMTNKESQNIEYKRTWRNECLKTVSAFANSNGGTLIIGLDDSGKYVGLKNAKKLLKDIPNTIRNKLGVIPSVETNNEIIKIIISPSSAPISYNGKYYLRSGSTVQALQGKDLADFLVKKTGISWDEVFEKLDLSLPEKTWIE